MDQMRAFNMNSTNYLFRNVSLNPAQQNQISPSLSFFHDNLFQFFSFLTSQLGSSVNNINYETNNIFISIFKVSPNFNFSNYFANRTSLYFPYVDMSDCLNEIMVTRLNNPYYKAWVTYVQWKVNPFSYNDYLYLNTTSPYHEVIVVDSTTNMPIIVNNCTKGIV